MDVCRCDLREWTMSMTVVLAVIAEPSRWVLESIQKILRCDLRRSGLLRGHRDGAKHDYQESPHKSPHRVEGLAIRNVLRYPTRSFRSASLNRSGPYAGINEVFS